jgi:phosphatidylglycerophosphate synthase
MTVNRPTFKPAERSHTSFLAAAEKRLLIRIAMRLPAWVNSDHLTGLGFVAIIGAGACYWWARWQPLALLAAIVCLAANWFGDSLDGTLARVRDQQRPKYGFYVDHMLDALGSFFLSAGLALSGYMTPAVACAFLIAYLLLSIEVYLATYSLGTFHLSYWHFGPTELRLLLIIGNLFALWDPYVLFPGHRFLLFDVGFSIGTAALCLILIQAVVSHTRKLYREETKPAKITR